MAGSSLTESVNVTSIDTHGLALVCVTQASLSESMQQLIDDINAKRKEDTHLMENYKKASEMHVSRIGNDNWLNCDKGRCNAPQTP